MGNASVSIKGSIKGLGVLLTTNMDEAGFLITNIDKDGRIEFEPLGCDDSKLISGQVVDVITNSGIVKGINTTLRL